ncbi:MAG: LysM peptidoglycan-binding domain-containing protein, partial [Chloroflexi bacterium]|nr:LysM peptidoglycan-binding domain-containing protein [Chloroflexota bacterium]
MPPSRRARLVVLPLAAGLSIASYTAVLNFTAAEPPRRSHPVAQAAVDTPGATSDAAMPTASLPEPQAMTDANSAEPPTAQPADRPLADAIRTYVVQSGDTVGSIAQRFGLTSETIVGANDLPDPDLLVSGRELKILPVDGLIHRVGAGDTVANIARSYGADVNAVVRANHLEPPYVIVPGQRVMVPGGRRPVQPQPTSVDAVANRSDSAGDGLAASAKPADANLTPPRQLPRLGDSLEERFIASIGEAALVSRDRTGVPASVTIAQAILESYWGSSKLAKEANNYFGIKAQTREGTAGVIWLDVWEVLGGENVVQSEPFRAYHDVADSFIDHGRFFLENRRYGQALTVESDPRQFAREIADAGYATDPA